MRSDEMSIVLLGGSDGIMAQELLDCTDINSLGQKLHGEGISESVRPRILDTSQGSETPNSAPHILCAPYRIPASRPEEILRIPGRQRHQRLGGVVVKLDLQGHSGFGRADGKMPGSFIKGRPAEHGDIPYAQTTVKQGVYERARTAADERRRSWIGAADAVAGGDQFTDFLWRERRGGDIFGQGHSQATSRIVGHPLPILAPSEERAEMFKLFTSGPRLDFARVAKSSQGLNVDMGDRSFGRYSVFQMGQGSPVAPRSGFSNVPGFHVLKKAVNGFPQSLRRYIDALEPNLLARAQGIPHGAARDPSLSCAAIW
jgi:hypothetical protein